MQIEIQIDEAQKEPKLIIRTDRMTEEIAALMKRLSGEIPRGIAGFRDGTAVLLDQAELIRVYAAGGKVYAVTDRGEYLVRLRLYELEERLDKRAFVRISNSEIIHLKRVRSFDLSFAGTICVSLDNGTAAYVSRRYVARIKQTLGI